MCTHIKYYICVVWILAESTSVARVVENFFIKLEPFDTGSWSFQKQSTIKVRVPHKCDVTSAARIESTTQVDGSQTHRLDQIDTTGKWTFTRYNLRLSTFILVSYMHINVHWLKFLQVDWQFLYGYRRDGAKPRKAALNTYVIGRQIWNE